MPAVEVKERPILFTPAMAQAIAEGRKTQTRRVVKPQPQESVTVGYDKSGQEIARRGMGWSWKVGNATPLGCPSPAMIANCPYGVPADRLWVREAVMAIGPLRPSGYWSNPKLKGVDYWYKGADEFNLPTWAGKRWTPNIHMPRAACRSVLEVVSVRVERVQDIGEEDAIAEGVPPQSCSAKLVNSPIGTLAIGTRPHRAIYELVWNAINGERSWDLNPWVWVVEFRKV